MGTIEDRLKDISEIRSMMEQSSKFLSLSGLSGISAGYSRNCGGCHRTVFHRHSRNGEFRLEWRRPFFDWVCPDPHCRIEPCGIFLGANGAKERTSGLERCHKVAAGEFVYSVGGGWAVLSYSVVSQHSFFNRAVDADLLRTRFAEHQQVYVERNSLSGDE